MSLTSPTLSTSDAALRALVDAIDAYPLGAHPGVEQQRAWATLEECLAAAKVRLAAASLPAALASPHSAGMARAVAI